MSAPSNWPLPQTGVRFLVPEFLRRQLRRNPLTRDLYPHALGYYPHAAGHHMRRDEHDDHLLLYCVSGRAWADVDGRRHQVGAGDLLLLPRNVAHTYAADDSDPWTIYWVHFDGAQSDRFMDELGFALHQPIKAIGTSPKLISDFETLLEVRQSGYRLPVFVHGANQLRQMLCYLALLSPRGDARGPSRFDLDQVHGLMQERLHDQLDLDTLAARMNLSKHAFCRKYKRATGHSAIQHFIHLKMEHACYLLDITARTVQQIAFDLGYQDAYYFSRLFRKVVGVSPTDYRRLKHG